MKLALTVAALLINAGTGVSAFVFLLIALNGYSESDAVWGLGTFAALMFITAVSVSAAVPLVFGRLIRKGMSKLISAVIVLSGCAVASCLAAIVFSFAAAGIAELVRVKF